MGTQSLIAQKTSNNWKTIFLMGFFLIVIIVIGFIISATTGNSSYFWWALTISLVMNFVGYFFSDTIALRTAYAEPADREKYAELYTIVTSLAEKIHIPAPRVYIINDAGPNAFATGRNERHASIAVTTGLLAMMHKSELEGVIAHELSHIKHRDILIMTVAVVFAGMLSMLGELAIRRSFTGERDNGNAALMFLISAIAAVVLPLAATLIQLAISRKREFSADAGSALATGYSEGLASALEKIDSYRQPLQHASPSTAHLYIACPFGGTERQTKLQKLFMTHPPIEERIAKLRGV